MLIITSITHGHLKQKQQCLLLPKFIANRLCVSLELVINDEYDNPDD